MNTLVLFAHGKESGPWGSKIQYLADIASGFGAQVMSPDYRDLASPEARVEHLLSLELPPHDRLVLVGSSMGAYVSTLASQAMEPDGLFLLAPAFYLPGYANQDPVPHSANVMVIHGWSDELIPCEHVMRFGSRHGATVVFTAGDHRLISALPKIGSLFAGFLRDHIVNANDSSSRGCVLDEGLHRPEQDFLERRDRNPGDL